MCIIELDEYPDESFVTDAKKILSLKTKELNTNKIIEAKQTLAVEILKQLNDISIENVKSILLCSLSILNDCSEKHLNNLIMNKDFLTPKKTQSHVKRHSDRGV